MEAFEKWLSKLDDKQVTRFTKQNRVIANLAWRDALKWIKENMISLYTEHGEVLSLDEFFKFVKRRIEAELGETKRMKQSGFDAVHKENYGENNGKRN